MTLLDDAMPRWDFDEVHRVRVRAGARAAYDALLTLDVSDVALSRLLMAVRELPARLSGKAPRLGGNLVAAIERAGFRRVAELPGEEVAWGIVGRFWRPWGNIEAHQPEGLAAFRAYREPGRAKGAWGFRFRDDGAGGAWITTETRVQATDAAARRRFAAYWLLVRPGSGLIRRDLLRAVGRRAAGG